MNINNNTINNLSNYSTNSSSYSYGISNTGTANAQITNNTISNLISQSSAPSKQDLISVCGIYQNATSTSTIKNNSIFSVRSISAPAPTGTNAAGIMLTGGINGRVESNYVYDITNSSGGTSAVAAGIISRDLGNNMLILNNMISLGLNTNGNQ